MAASLAAIEAVFLRGLLTNVGSAPVGPTTLAIDNSGAVALSRDYISNGKTKHIERRHLKVRELVEEAVVSTVHIPTADNVADILTKPLGYRRFEKLRKLLMNHA
jgi:DNA integrity scanning protein DisA with diadenylate cyclase activity